MKNRRFLNRLGGASCFCFYCGVDSKPLIFLFVATLGFAILGSVMVFAWSVVSGHWADSEKPKYKVLEVENDGIDGEK